MAAETVDTAISWLTTSVDWMILPSPRSLPIVKVIQSEIAKVLLFMLEALNIHFRDVG